MHKIDVTIHTETTRSEQQQRDNTHFGGISEVFSWGQNHPVATVPGKQSWSEWATTAHHVGRCFNYIFVEYCNGWLHL